jgi:hypothetical protein
MGKFTLLTIMGLTKLGFALVNGWRLGLSFTLRGLLGLALGFTYILRFGSAKLGAPMWIPHRT